jgi:AraC-like DNA-binding protein/DNA gyrase inhibitor GyrI
VDYIGQHLEDELSLARLSQIGCFSPFHFHRIFQAVTGETLNSHVRRVRLERAATLMRASPRRRITDISIEAGFPGTAELSRAFKNHFGRAPSSWDRRRPLEKSKICQAPDAHPFYSVEELESWKAANKIRVQLTQSGAFRYVYIRVYQPYGSTRLVDAYRALMSWLASRGTDFRDVVFIGMSLDDPAITPLENCRYDLGVAFPAPGPRDGMVAKIVHSRGRGRGEAPVPQQSECGSGSFSIRDFEPRELAAIHCVGDLANVDRAWHYLYRIWLPATAFEPADLPAMEVFVRLPEEIGWETFDLQTCIPVVRF